MSDPLSELFRALRVKGAVYFAQDFASPWGMRLPGRPHAQFHVALKGRCAVDIGDRRIMLDERDVALIPTGAPHVVSDGSGAPLRDGREVVQSVLAGNRPFPGAATSVRLLCGHFEFSEARHPFRTMLPDVIHAPTRSRLDIALFDALHPLLMSETAEQRAGAQIVAERLVEIFLVVILRHHFTSQQARPGLLAAMFDPRLSQGITEMHRRWSEPLTLLEVAKASGMSRSAFAERFKATAGMTPMSYLARWRLLKARELLANRRLSIAEVAQNCGHRSAEGFSRSFKRAYGESPASLRAGETTT